MTINSGKYMHYRIREVSALLNIPAYTLRYWENEFALLAPKRTEFGQRRYTSEDVELLKFIKYLLHDKRMSVDGAKKLLSTYRRLAPRNEFICKSKRDAIRLLNEVKDGLIDLHPIARINAVEEWIKNA